jgi:hypothetical protein
MAVVWAAVTRDGVVLAECGQDDRGGAVLALAKRILKKKPTAGYEYDSSRSHALKALKFHVHKVMSGSPVVWSAVCVYDSFLEEVQARSFLEKVCLLTDPLHDEPLWQHGETLACQDSFAPTLLQRMEQVASMGRMAMVSKQVDETRALMADNIELLLARGEKLEELEGKATNLAKLSIQFRRRARDAKRFQLWQQAKFGLAVGTAVTVGVGVVVVPPLVAVL